MPNNLPRIRDVFDEWAAKGWGDEMEDSHGPFVRQTFERLPLRRGSWYLDIGCGNGYTVRWAAQIVESGRAVGIDLSPAMIERAHALSQGLANTEFHVAAFPHDHPLPPERFDVIFSMEVFYYLPDLDAALREVRRLLKPAGVFACQVDAYLENAASHAWPEEVGLEMTLLDEAGWRTAFERAGLEIADQFRVRVSEGEGASRWQVTEGSLVTMGRRA